MRLTLPGRYSNIIQQFSPVGVNKMVALSFPTTQFKPFSTLMDDALLIERARKGDLNAFNELVLTYQDVVYRQAFWILHDERAAEDATQEAFLRAYLNLDSFRGGPFRPWMLRITTNYCLDQIRRQKTRQTIALEEYNQDGEEIENSPHLIDSAAPIEELIERSDQEAAILDSINQLPSEYRVAIIMVDLQGLDYNEAAKALGVPMGTFKSRLSRARGQVRDLLNSHLN
jgi:RNA polymerase sigma-70 factor, ECF subfamily